ncbi:conserved hypothetical protein [Theileria equi strain WA]|uniref:Serine aminopeptidase S33 domain-containing protein n=1 Tax=Theileria equi strain WA TaxID=1537102 RepID=L1LCA3_THEEQ|nr:conserved hypothetical protein [Theileria equi strain WA]EKX72976.1 conserved hypothetical protein [Theileria equi strain WA]|eukprot:XP_004832428.1 conserved hypothetical protein [Theileria equi strain WA]
MLVIQGLFGSLVLIVCIIRKTFAANLSQNALYLDISRNAGKGFNVEHRSYSGVTHFVYTPNQRYNVERVVEGDKQIWVRENGEKCVNIHAFYRKNEWLLVRIIIERYGFLHDKFYNNKGEWVQITEDESNKKLKLLKIPLYLKPPNRVPQSSVVKTVDKKVVETLTGQINNETCANILFVTLDIGNVDSLKFSKFITAPYGLNISVLSPQQGYTLNKIVDGEILICENAHGYLSARVSIYSGVPSILHLYTIDTNNAEVSTYFINVVKWEQVQVDVFYRIFHELVVNKNTFKLTDLNTDKVKPDFVCFNSPNNYPSLVCFPNPGYILKSVNCNNKTIWKRKLEGENCICASFHSKGSPQFAHLIISTSSYVEELFYYLDGKAWNVIGKYEYRLKLHGRGIDLCSIDNRILLDVSKPVDAEKFVLHTIGTKTPSISMMTPFPGALLTKIIDGEDTIWEAQGDEYCIYFWLCLPNSSGMSYALVTNSNKTRIVHYFLKSKKWRSVSKSEYFAKYLLEIVPNFSDERIVNASIKENHKGKIMTGSFTNRQGLRLRSYAIIAENHRATLIISSGIRGHFISGFFPYNLEWNFENFGFQIPPSINDVILMRTSEPLSSYFCLNQTAKYKHLFEYKDWNRADAIDLLPQFQFEGSFIQFLNMMGYSIYGLELQSHGFSESISDMRCYFRDSDDSAYDMLQFVSIVKRGKFGDPNEKWNEEIVYKSVPTDKRTFLFGFSMGTNVVIRAAQIFNAHVKCGEKIADGIIGISSMLNIDKLLGIGKHFLCIIKLFSKLMDKKDNSVEKYLNYGESVYIFMRYNDPWFFVKKMSFKTGYILFDSVDMVKQNLEYILTDMPVLFIHSTDDPMCSVDGPKEFKNKLPNRNVTLIETCGCGHFITDALVSPIINPMIDNWINGLSGNISGM